MKNTSISLKFYVFFVKHSKDADAHIRVCTLTPTNACMQPYPYEPSERLSRLILEIDEITTDTLLSPTTKKIVSNNSSINLEKI